MKTIFTVLVCLTLLCIGILWVSFQELYSENRVLRSDIKGLQNQADSLERVTKLQSDTIRIAKNTIILQDTKIVKDEKEVTTKTDSHEKIVFVNLNDSSRHSKLAKFYPSYKRVGFNALGD